MSGEGGSSEGNTAASTTRVVVNRQRQHGNPLLHYVRAIRYEWGDCGADIEMEGSIGIVYLALSYHKLHSQYIHTRINGKAENAYKVKILLVVDNITESRHALRELSLLCFRQGWSLVLTKGVEEAAEYIEVFKLSERKEIPMEGKKKTWGREEGASDEKSQMVDQAVRMVSGARGVTKSDAKRVLASLGSLHQLSYATERELSLCAGLGAVRVPSILSFLDTPFTS